MNGVSVTFDLFIDNISNNLNFLTSDIFNELLTMILESQLPGQNQLHLEIPPGKIRRFCCHKRLVKQELKDEMCPICLKKYKNKSKVVKPNECDHLFHSRCLKKWFEYKSTCPVCRKLCSFEEN